MAKVMNPYIGQLGPLPDAPPGVLEIGEIRTGQTHGGRLLRDQATRLGDIGADRLRRIPARARCVALRVSDAVDSAARRRLEQGRVVTRGMRPGRREIEPWRRGRMGEFQCRSPSFRLKR